MAMDPARQQALYAAFMEAFPDPSDLDLLTGLYLGVNAGDIPGFDEPRPARIAKLLAWAAARDRVGDLVRAAVQVNPTNRKLQDVAAQIAADPPPAPETAPATNGQTARDMLDPTATPPTVPPPLGPIRQRWAVLVGINSYVNPAFAPLNFCVADVEALGAALAGLGYSVKTLTDTAADPVRQPTRANIEEALAQVCSLAAPDDLIWVHFACHGVLLQGQAVLVARDTGQASIATTGLPLAQVEATLRAGASRRVILTLDACHTGVAMGRAGSDPAFNQHVYEQAEGFAVIAASTAQQTALEWRDVGHGVFTYYLLEALSGQADRAHKGFVTVDDVRLFVLNALRIWAFDHNGAIQEPTARTEGLGDMVLVPAVPAAAGA